MATDPGEGWDIDGPIWLTEATVAKRFRLEPGEVRTKVHTGSAPGELRWRDGRVRIRVRDLRQWERALAPAMETRA